MKVFTKILGPLTPPHKSLRSFLILFIDILVKNTYFRWNNTVHICSVTCDEICSLKMQEKFSKLAGNEVILPRTNFHAPATPPDLNNLVGSLPQMDEKNVKKCVDKFTWKLHWNSNPVSNLCSKWLDKFEKVCER